MVVGVDVGGNTLENLASQIRDRTYPSLPAFIEQIDCDGKRIVLADIAGDTPPIVGVYLYAGDAVDPGAPVDAGKLQAYRRVGRTNLKEDFMRLRGELLSDPKLRLALSSGARATGLGLPEQFSGTVWA